MIKIAVILEMTSSYGRGVLSGVMEFANLRSGWMFIQPPMYTLAAEKWTGWQQADGIVTMIHTSAMIDQFRRSKIPLVNTARTMSSKQMLQLQVPTVLPDDDAVGRMAFEYLYDRQFRAFGFCGHPTASWSKVRKDAFADECAKRHCSFSQTVDDDAVSRDWILSLRRPSAILAANDHFGWCAIDVCREAGISVPEEIAVLAVDNDIVLNNMVRPTLSSVDLGAERIGFEAAKMLEQFMQGKKFSDDLIQIQPNGIHTRHSTDVLNIEDPAVADAARFIREHASEPISVEDVLAEVAMSRRNLERRFKKALQRSLLDEIIRVRLNRASALLRDSNLDIERVAEQSGFNSHVRFTTVFHEMMKQTPSAYRKAHRTNSR